MGTVAPTTSNHRLGCRYRVHAIGQCQFCLVGPACMYGAQSTRGMVPNVLIDGGSRPAGASGPRPYSYSENDILDSHRFTYTQLQLEQILMKLFTAAVAAFFALVLPFGRSEERRVGKECR